MSTYRRTLRPVYRLAALAIACTALFVAVDSGLAATPPARLLATYEPVTRFDPQERFLPASVQSFVADSPTWNSWSRRRCGRSWIPIPSRATFPARVPASGD